MEIDDDTAFAANSGTPPSAEDGFDAWLNGGASKAAATAVPSAETADSAVEPVALGPVNAAEAFVVRTFTTPRKLVGADGAELVVDPEGDVYHFESTSLKPLTALFQMPANAWEPIYSAAMDSARAGDPAQPLARLRWYAGLIATPGILARDLSRDALFKLNRWPETEREFPHQFRIAKAMLAEPVTLAAISAASGAALEDVIDYVNASHAAGRLEVLSPDGVNRPRAAPASAGARLMAILNKPLFAG